MNHFFDKDLACEFGLAEAIILNHLEFWIEKNKANGTNFFDGYYWTFNSTKAYAEIFPYFSQHQIQLALKHLKELNIIQTGNYNAVAYDRTTWYAFTEYGETIMQKCKMDFTNTQYSIMQKCKMEDAKMSNGLCKNVKWKMQKCQMDYVKMSNGLCKNVEPIPVNKPYNKPVNKTDKKKNLDSLIDAYTENDSLKSAIHDFIEFRKQIKAPLTEKALTLSFNKLDKLANTNDDLKISIINQSIERGWRGLFEVKETAKPASSASDYDIQDISQFWN